MKVVRHFLWAAATTVGFLPTVPFVPVVAGDEDRRHLIGGVRGDGASSGATAAATDAARLPVSLDDEDESGQDRMLAVCGNLTCSPQLNFCTMADYKANRCEMNYTTLVRPDSSDDDDYNETEFVCPSTRLPPDPTVLVLANLKPCAKQISRIKFNLALAGVSVRSYTDNRWPYTVFGDTVRPLAAGSRVLAGFYNLRVDIKGHKRRKGRKGQKECLLDRQNYYFFISCI